MSQNDSHKKQMVIDNPWRSLRRYTDARIGLGHTGVSMPTQAQLAFQLAHAKARDAVHIPLDFDILRQQLNDLELSSIKLQSQVHDRLMYLQRPDLGRRLDETSVDALKHHFQNSLYYDATIVLVDGLSSTAVEKHGALMAKVIKDNLMQMDLSCGPICLVEQGRVAIGDEIGEIIGSRLLFLLIGERPGLSSPDSLGLYYTFQPRVGLTDESRNCISNIRPAGLPLEAAAARLMWLVNESERMQLSGVQLKDKSDNSTRECVDSQSFLLKK